MLAGMMNKYQANAIRTCKLFEPRYNLIVARIAVRLLTLIADFLERVYNDQLGVLVFFYNLSQNYSNKKEQSKKFGCSFYCKANAEESTLGDVVTNTFLF